jgi:hypothetical protein
MSSILLLVKGFERFAGYIIKIYGLKGNPGWWRIFKIEQLRIYNAVAA